MNNHLNLHFVRPGLQTTVQGHSRCGYQAYGVPLAGPMDSRSAKLANWLVGNYPDDPLLEMTLMGPEIRIEGQGQIALTGADMSAVLDNEKLPRYQTIDLTGRHLLKLGQAINGCRAYLSIRGSWRVREWLESPSASPQNGTQLTPNSVIKKDSKLKIESDSSLSLRSAEIPNWDPISPTAVRVLAGPEYHQFSTACIKAFLGGLFSLSPESNRMGFRLERPLTDCELPIEVISSGVVPGTIQVTKSGQLVLLMSDAQTSGGYPRIANIISADLHNVAQLRPGDKVKFTLVSLKDAYQALTQKV